MQATKKEFVSHKFGKLLKLLIKKIGSDLKLIWIPKQFLLKIEYNFQFQTSKVTCRGKDICITLTMISQLFYMLNGVNIAELADRPGDLCDPCGSPNPWLWAHGHHKQLPRHVRFWHSTVVQWQGCFREPPRQCFFHVSWYLTIHLANYLVVVSINLIIYDKIFDSSFLIFYINILSFNVFCESACIINNINDYVKYIYKKSLHSNSYTLSLNSTQSNNFIL